MIRIGLLLLACVGLNAVQPTPETALAQLMEGNQRYVENHLTTADLTAERRLKLTEIQEPFAIILGCSDSRVSPEILFDQGIGDLFVVRVAGNVVGPVVLDSIEYSALYLHSALILVMGHQNCGAVAAVLNGTTKDIESVASLIKPAIDEAKAQPGDQLENAIKDNVHHMVQQLKATPSLAKLMQEKKLGIVGGYYDFSSGSVKIIDSL